MLLVLLWPFLVLFSFRQRRRRSRIGHSAGRSVTLMMMIVTVYVVVMMSNVLRRCRVVVAPIATPSFATVVVSCGDRGAVMMVPTRNVTGGGNVGRMIARRSI